ncbi:MAG: ribonuclease E/G [Magnetococcales bacterium]|nr:ribonuclease E/G [Magnetococcales bacterium]
MTKRMLVDATHPEEIRVAIVQDHKLIDLDIEASSREQIKGNIYLARVSRVEPSLQAAFIDFGGGRQGFLSVNDIHPKYYPTSDKGERNDYLPMPLPEPEDEEEEYEEEEDEEGESELNGVDAGDDSSIQAVACSVSKSVMTSEPSILSAAALCATGSEGEKQGAVAVAAELEADLGADLVSAVDSSLEQEPESAEPSRLLEESPRAPEAAAPVAQSGAEGSEELEAGGDELENGVEIDDDGAPILDSFRRFPRRQRLPIQKILTRGQKLLVQVVKEPRGNKGASLTTNLSLAGRYAVLLPENEGGGGISRKITDGVERKKLKEILETIAIPGQVSLIIRTAGLGRTKREIIRDLNYLLRLWKKILDNAALADGPTLIHEEGDLIMRTIRDLYSSDMSEILIEGHEAYRRGKDFMRLLMPRYMKVVQPYKEPQPIFSRFQIEHQIESMHERIIQLKSGGYIVIEPTEAMVTIDINSGRSTREKDVETTAFKTNLQATEEIARQLRLRDLGGLIVIDFIDMEDKKHNLEVERQMREALKLDRAKIQLGKISQFGLLELSRQRMKPTFSETNRMECPRCKGAGTIRSVESTAIYLFRMLEEDLSKNRFTRIVYRTSWDVANYLLNHKRTPLVALETSSQVAVVIQGDESLQTPEYRVERVERARVATAPEELVEQKGARGAGNAARGAGQKGESVPAAEADAVSAVRVEVKPAATAGGSEGEGGEGPEDGAVSGAETVEKKKRRRRRRRKSGVQSVALSARAVEPSGDELEEGEEGEESEELAERGEVVVSLDLPGIQGVQATAAPGLFILARAESEPVASSVDVREAVLSVVEAGAVDLTDGGEEGEEVSAPENKARPQRRRRRRRTSSGGSRRAASSATTEESAEHGSSEEESSRKTEKSADDVPPWDV